MMRLHMIIHGSVIGVFFRAFVQKHAHSFGITGFVRNTPEKTVEVVAEGGKADLQELLKRCEHGPSNAIVMKIEKEWLAATGEFRAFEMHR